MYIGLKVNLISSTAACHHQSLQSSHKLDHTQLKRDCQITDGRFERHRGVWLAGDVKDSERLRHGRQLQYLAGVVVVKPALQVDGVPAWHQTAVLENPQFSRGVVACGDDFMEGVFQRHGVIVSSLVLKDQQGGREGSRPRSISSKNICWRSSWTNNWCSKRVETEYICTLLKQ